MAVMYVNASTDRIPVEVRLRGLLRECYADPYDRAVADRFHRQRKVVTNIFVSEDCGHMQRTVRLNQTVIQSCINGFATCHWSALPAALELLLKFKTGTPSAETFERLTHCHI